MRQTWRDFFFFFNVFLSLGLYIIIISWGKLGLLHWVLHQKRRQQQQSVHTFAALYCAPDWLIWPLLLSATKCFPSLLYFFLHPSFSHLTSFSLTSSHTSLHTNHLSNKKKEEKKEERQSKAKQNDDDDDDWFAFCRVKRVFAWGGWVGWVELVDVASFYFILSHLFIGGHVITISICNSAATAAAPSSVDTLRFFTVQIPLTVKMSREVSSTLPRTRALLKTKSLLIVVVVVMNLPCNSSLLFLHLLLISNANCSITSLSTQLKAHCPLPFSLVWLGLAWPSCLLRLQILPSTAVAQILPVFQPFSLTSSLTVTGWIFRSVLGVDPRSLAKPFFTAASCCDRFAAVIWRFTRALFLLSSANQSQSASQSTCDPFVTSDHLHY